MPSFYREGRGFFGWVFLILFLAFNAFMALYLVMALSMGASALVNIVGTGIILFVWTCGAVITGLLALLTRGRRIY